MENAKATGPVEQAAVARQRWERSYGHRREDWPGPLTEPSGLEHEELELLRGKVAGHRWDGWRRLTGDEGCFAACSCGWRSSGTGGMSPMLREVKEHLDAVRAVRGGRLSTRPAPAPARDERERSSGQREMRTDERRRELYARVQSQQRRLSETLERSADLLSAGQEQAGQLVAVLEHAAANVAPQWARSWAAAQSEQALQSRAGRVRELRSGILAAAAALAAIAGEVALAGQDLQTRCPGDAAGYRRLAGGPADRRGGREGVADDLRVACGLGRAAG